MMVAFATTLIPSATAGGWGDRRAGRPAAAHERRRRGHRAGGRRAPRGRGARAGLLPLPPPSGAGRAERRGTRVAGEPIVAARRDRSYDAEAGVWDEAFWPLATGVDTRGRQRIPARLAHQALELPWPAAGLRDRARSGRGVRPSPGASPAGPSTAWGWPYSPPAHSADRPGGLAGGHRRPPVGPGRRLEGGGLHGARVGRQLDPRRRRGHLAHRARPASVLVRTARASVCRTRSGWLCPRRARSRDPGGAGAERRRGATPWMGLDGLGLCSLRSSRRRPDQMIRLVRAAPAAAMLVLVLLVPTAAGQSVGAPRTTSRTTTSPSRRALTDDDLAGSIVVAHSSRTAATSRSSCWRPRPMSSRAPGPSPTRFATRSAAPAAAMVFDPDDVGIASNVPGEASASTPPRWRPSTPPTVELLRHRCPAAWTTSASRDPAAPAGTVAGTVRPARREARAAASCRSSCCSIRRTGRLRLLPGGPRARRRRRSRSPRSHRPRANRRCGRGGAGLEPRARAGRQGRAAGCAEEAVAALPRGGERLADLQDDLEEPTPVRSSRRSISAWSRPAGLQCAAALLDGQPAPPAPAPGPSSRPSAPATGRHTDAGSGRPLPAAHPAQPVAHGRRHRRHHGPRVPRARQCDGTATGDSPSSDDWFRDHYGGGGGFSGGGFGSGSNGRSSRPLPRQLVTTPHQHGRSQRSRYGEAVVADRSQRANDVNTERTTQR